MTTHTQYVPPFPWDLDAFPFVAATEVRTIPAVRGLYFLRSAEAVLYIGQSVNIRKRWRGHERLRQVEDRLRSLSLAWLPLPHASQWLLRTLESLSIGHYAPALNVEIVGPQRRPKKKDDSYIHLIPWMEGLIRTRERDGREVPEGWRRELAELYQEKQVAEAEGAAHV